MVKRYDYTGSVASGTRGRAVVVGDELEKIEAAFDTFPEANGDGTGFDGPLPVGPATDADHAVQLDQLTNWDFNVNANGFRLYGLPTPMTPTDATTKTWVESAIAAALLLGGSPGDIGITELGVGTATALQPIRINAAGNGVEGYTLTIGNIGVGGLDANSQLRVNSAGTAIVSYDPDLGDGAAAIYAFLYL